MLPLVWSYLLRDAPFLDSQALPIKSAAKAIALLSTGWRHFIADCAAERDTGICGSLGNAKRWVGCQIPVMQVSVILSRKS